MADKFKLGHNRVKATKKICAKREDAIDHCKVNQIAKEILFGL